MRSRLAFLRDLAADVRESARRRSRRTPAEPDRRTSEELGRRLDETRERLRRETPPPEEDR